MYYKTKLNVHNFTMYNLATYDIKCYWYDETGSSLEVSTYASCIVDTLRTALSEEVKPIVIQSDGCGSQNKNAVLYNALLHLSMEFDIVIKQKWVVKGHTYMECDSVHNKIEAVFQSNPNKAEKKFICQAHITT